MDAAFELPLTKRVRRSALHSPSSCRTTPDRSSPLPQLETTHDIPTFDAPSPPPPKQVQEQTYEFRLFRSAPAAVGERAAHRISVRSPTPPSEGGGGGFLGAGRPLGYYLTAHVAGEVRKEARSRFRAAAVEGRDVRGKGVGSCAWRGCELPWRVMRVRGLRAAARKATSGSAVPEESTPASTARRKRAGKKRRIAVRRKVKAEGAKEQAAKEKKVRKNSQKKARKREKDREKRARGTLGREKIQEPSPV